MRRFTSPRPFLVKFHGRKAANSFKIQGSKLDVQALHYMPIGPTTKIIVLVINTLGSYCYEEKPGSENNTS